MNDKSLLTFPCRFPIKVFGAQDGDFERLVFDLVKPHLPGLRRQDLASKPSRSSSYLAVTVDAVAVSQQQLDAIYADLTASKAVLMAL